jgi:hypothetical protein
MLNSIYKSRKIGLPHHLGKKKVRKCNLWRDWTLIDLTIVDFECEIENAVNT